MMSAARNPCFLIHDDAYTDAMELNDDNECMPAFLEIHVLKYSTYLGTLIHG